MLVPGLVYADMGLIRDRAKQALRAAQQTPAYRSLRPLVRLIGIHEASAAERKALEARYVDCWKSKAFVQLVASSGRLIFGDVVFAREKLHGDRVREAWLYRLAVRAWCRNLGIGDRLVVSVLECARREGFGLVNLEVSPRNLAAIALYRRRGFVSVSELRMRRKL